MNLLSGANKSSRLMPDAVQVGSDEFSKQELEEGKRFTDSRGMLLIKSSPNTLQKVRARLGQDAEYIWSFTRES